MLRLTKKKQGIKKMPFKNQRVSVKESIEKKHKFLNDTSRKQKTSLSSPNSQKTKKHLTKILKKK